MRRSKLQWILHDWSDEHCLRILKNCYKALPDSGKLIVVESILPLAPDPNLSSKFVFLHDMLMLAYNPGGKERTEKELEELVKGAGFASFDLVCCAYGYWVMECKKKMWLHEVLNDWLAEKVVFVQIIQYQMGTCIVQNSSYYSCYLSALCPKWNL